MKTKLSLALGALVVGLALPSYILFSGSTSDGVVQVTQPTTETEALFLSLATNLVPPSFATGILTDPRFLSLVDLHTAVLPEALGKKDPFAPLGR